MAVSMAELKKARDIIADYFSISSGAAARAVGALNAAGRVDDLRAVIGGDLSSVPGVLSDLGITGSITDSKPAAGGSVGAPGGAVAASGSASDKIPATPKKTATMAKSKRKDTSSRGAGDLFTASAGGQGVNTPRGASDDLQRVEGEVVDNIPGVLPDNVASLVMGAIDSYCEQNNISDLSKERQPRWGAACYLVGQSVFKGSKILHDMNREKINGGIVYDVGRVSALVELWGVLCQNFCKAPMIDDFAHFAGVSDSWLYGVGSAEGLTPERAALLQKLKRMQESGLAGLIVDGRQNPTGALAMLNHCHGWTQTREIIHTSGGSQNAAALPVFGSDGLQIEDKSE